MRQENILPIECARNEGRFYGLVLKGKQPFTGLQRLGILVIGLEMVLFAVLLFLIALWSLDLDLSPTSILKGVSNLPANAVLGLILAATLGVRFCWVAFKGTPRKRAN